MKRFIFILLILIESLFLYSQVQNDEITKGGFCSFKGQFYIVENSFSITMGGEVGFIIKDFRLGAYFDGMSKAAKITENEKNYKLRQSHGGIYFGYPFFNEHKFHLITDIKVGYGTAHLLDTNLEGYDRAGFVALVPSASVEYSVTNIFKISLGINYQFHIKAKNPEQYKMSILNQPGVYVGITLGLF